MCTGLLRQLAPKGSPEELQNKNSTVRLVLRMERVVNGMGLRLAGSLCPRMVVRREAPPLLEQLVCSCSVLRPAHRRACERVAL